MSELMTADKVRRLSKEPDPKVDEWIEEELVRFFRESETDFVYVLRHQKNTCFTMQYLAKELERRGFTVSMLFGQTRSSILELKVSFPPEEE